jgi:cytoskeletal protein CcmA (bactofilin family)
MGGVGYYFDQSVGNVGIGTQAPGASLHVSSSTESLAGEKLFEVDGKALGSVLFATGSGRVGIRTNTPTAPLSVVGTISSSAGLMIAGPASFSGDLELSGAAFVSGALNVTGAATVTSLISLTAMSGAGGASAQTLTTDGQISGSAGLSVVGGIVCDSSIDLTGTLLVQKAAFVSGALNVSGTITADSFSISTAMSGAGGLSAQSLTVQQNVTGAAAVQAQTLAIQAGMTVTGSSLVHGTFNAQKAQSAAVVATDGNITVGENHFFIMFEGSSAATASLPAVSGKTGRMYHFANQSFNDSHFVIDGNGGEQVNNGLGHTMEHGGATIGLICDGTQWILFTAYEPQSE